MEGYRYYSAQRPADLLTYPGPPDNPLVEIKDYDCGFRIPISRGTFQA